MKKARTIATTGGRKKLSVLLVQLPVPNVRFYRDMFMHANIPLAAGYLKAAAYRDGLLHRADIEILGRREADHLSDAALVEQIVARSPDVLGFSLYLWNSARSLFVAGEVKKRLPGTVVIAGGPEVTADNRFVREHFAVDVGCIGEGENAFADILRSALDGWRDLGSVRGIFYRQAGTVLVTPPRAPMTDLDTVPSPYLLGFIDPREYGEARVETSRGCPFRCSYCAYATRSTLGRFSLRRIREEIRFIAGTGTVNIYFFDSSLAHARYLKTLLKSIAQMNRDRRLRFSAEMHPEYIDGETAGLLKDCNFTDIEIGLQSVNPAALRAVGRRFDRQKFLRAVRLLRERGIKPAVDVIIGLPGDTAGGIRGTHRFLRTHGLLGVLQVFRLHVLPGTLLKAEATRYGLRFAEEPPYSLKESRSLSPQEMKESLALFQGGYRAQPIDTFTGYCRCRFPSRGEPRGRPIPRLDRYPRLIDKVVIELDPGRQGVREVRALAREMQKAVNQSFTAWFRMKDGEGTKTLISGFLAELRSANPHLCLNVIIEAAGRAAVSVPRLTEAARAAGRLSSSPSFVIPAGSCTPAAAAAIRRHGNLVYAADIGRAGEIDVIASLIRAGCRDGILVDAPARIPTDRLLAALEGLGRAGERGTAAVHFRNPAFVYSGLVGDRPSKADFPRRMPPKYYFLETIVIVDEELRPFEALAPDGKVRMELVAWQAAVRRRLGREMDGNPGFIRPRGW